MEAWKQVSGESEKRPRGGGGEGGQTMLAKGFPSFPPPQTLAPQDQHTRVRRVPERREKEAVRWIGRPPRGSKAGRDVSLSGLWLPRCAVFAASLQRDGSEKRRDGRGEMRCPKGRKIALDEGFQRRAQRVPTSPQAS